jgi:hypothetical protein
MASRRDFVAGGIALAASAAMPFEAAPALSAGSSRSLAKTHDLELVVVVDRALAAAAPFASEAAARGHHVLSFEDDAGALWMNELEPRLRAGPLAIAGLTGAAAAFCFETLTRSYRGRALARAEHASLTVASLAPLLAAATQAEAALPPFAHVARAPHTAPAFLTWLIETRN